MDRRAWMLMWALALVWGASYLFIKLALEDMEPVFVVWARLVLAGAVLIPLALRADALRGMREALGPLAVVSLIQVVGPFLLITFGELHITSSMTGILVASAPIFTALLGIFGPAQDRVNAWSMGGVLIGIVGVALLFGLDLTSSSTALAGGLMVLLAGLGYAVGALYLRRRLGHLQPIGLAASTMSLSALMLTPAAAFFLPASVPGLEAGGALAALGILGTGLAFAIFYRLIADVGAQKSSLVAYLAPGFALLYGAVFLGEHVTAGSVGGLLLILAGSWTAASGRAPWERRPLPAPATA